MDHLKKVSGYCVAASSESSYSGGHHIKPSGLYLKRVDQSLSAGYANARIAVNSYRAPCVQYTNEIASFQRSFGRSPIDRPI